MLKIFKKIKEFVAGKEATKTPVKKTAKKTPARKKAPVKSKRTTSRKKK